MNSSIERTIKRCPLFFAIILLLCSCTSVSDLIESNMVDVPAGIFIFGCEDDSAELDEGPVHEVCVNSFRMSKYELTQEIWISVMRYNPSFFKGKNLPVESVSYNDVKGFIDKLNKKTGHSYRLPTEVEWEYAAKYVIETSNTPIQEYAWFCDNSAEETHPVGEKAPNALGIYDLVGNVNEWTDTHYSGCNYAGIKILSEEDNLSNLMVFRGGSFNAEIKHCRISNRNYAPADVRNYSLGFRLVE